MKAMVFAAGLGTRLHPITNTIPKALVKIGATPLLEFAVKKLLYHGFGEIIINVHHYPEKILAFLKENNNFGANISISDESDLLLDTGGGLKKAAAFFSDDQPFLIYNCDIITDLNLRTLYEFHLKQNAICTLAVMKRESSRYLLFDNEDILCGWENKKTGEIKHARESLTSLHLMAFSGIHIMSPAAFELLSDKKVFSLIEFYLMIANSQIIRGYDHTYSRWADIGKLSVLEEMQKERLEEYL
jgi:NDP-sugar pyrophosphorylase family protein